MFIQIYKYGITQQTNYTIPIEQYDTSLYFDTKNPILQQPRYFFKTKKLRFHLDFNTYPFSNLLKGMDIASPKPSITARISGTPYIVSTVIAYVDGIFRFYP